MPSSSKLGLLGAIGLLAAVTTTSAAAQECPSVGRQPATLALQLLVDADPVLKGELADSIALGQRVNSDPVSNPVASIDDYYDFVDALVTYNPQNIDTGIVHEGIRVSMDGANYCNWNILDLLAYSYFLVDRQITTDPRGQIQFMNDKFSLWLKGVAESWGLYLETPESAIHVPDFTNDPNFGDWYCPDGPYATFQDFFTRELCSDTFPTGSRPVEGFADPRTVVSIGDSNSMGWWPISDNGKLVTDHEGISQAGRQIKGKLYSDIPEFIIGGPDEFVIQGFGTIDPNIFDGGIFTHQFLNVNNYHRLHVPVSGKLVYMRHFQAGTRMKSAWKPALGPETVAYYDPLDTADWQFGQTRLVLGIETPNHGIVIASPMGMAQVSSIRLRDWVKQDAHAVKGWEFANFAFGGSDFVILFQEDAGFRLTVPTMPEVPPGAGVNYKPSLQGERYGCFNDVPDCSTTPVVPPPYPGYE